MNLSSRWQLPGPSRFVDQIVREMRSGKNVVIQVPPNQSAGLYESVRDALRNDDFICVKFTQEALGQPPIDFLYARFAPDAPPHELRSVKGLYSHGLFAERLIWIERPSTTQWVLWNEFLHHYQHVCGEFSEIERSIICIEFEGDLSSYPPIEDTRLVWQRMHGVVAKLDTLILASQEMNDRGLPDLSMQIAIAVIAQIALWDLELVPVLAKLSLQELLNPKTLLTRLQELRRWDSSISAWYEGSENIVDGKLIVHPSFFSGENGEKELNRRIWYAQIGLLMPYIEERRVALIHELERYLEVPFSTKLGQEDFVVHHRIDLEIGHVYHQIRNNYRVSRSIIDEVERLKKVRNKLAHLDSIDADLVKQL